jgi:two-component system, NarL family, sensor kinase
MEDPETLLKGFAMAHYRSSDSGLSDHSNKSRGEHRAWLRPLLLVLVASVSGLFSFEMLKQLLFPGIKIWESHFVTIIFGSIVAVVAAHVVMRKQQATYRRTLEEMEERERVERNLAGTERELALQRQREADVRQSREMLQSAIDALSAQIAVLDEDVCVVAVNESWRRFALETRFRGPTFGIGERYLARCDGMSDADVRTIDQGLGAVLREESSDFRMVYRCDLSAGNGWFQLRVSSFQEGERKRLVLSLEDVTEVKRAEESLRDLAGRILESQDHERRRIARELHDSAAQSVFAITLNIARLQTLMEGAPPAAQKLLSESLALARQGLQEIRTISYLLHPPLLEGVGLVPALRSYVEGFSQRSGIQVDLTISPQIEQLSPHVENAIFRMTQETLTNIHRHAQTQRANIELKRAGDDVVLEVRDQGKGIRGAGETAMGASFGVGLSAMRERIDELGGRLEISSTRSGTVLIATMPATLTKNQSSAA